MPSGGSVWRGPTLRQPQAERTASCSSHRWTNRSPSRSSCPLAASASIWKLVYRADSNPSLSESDFLQGNDGLEAEDGTEVYASAALVFRFRRRQRATGPRAAGDRSSRLGGSLSV